VGNHLTDKARKALDQVAALKSRIAELENRIANFDVPGSDKSVPVSSSAPTPVSSVAPANDSNDTLQNYASELEAEIDRLKDLSVDIRGERERVLLSLSEIVKDATRFGYFVREEFGSLEAGDDHPLGKIAGRLKFFLEAIPRNLANAGVSNPDLIGIDYAPGLNVEAINLEEFGEADKLVIVDVVEPLLTYTPKNVDVSDDSQRYTIRVGKVLVAKKEN
jgi:hypothetical protein